MQETIPQLEEELEELVSKFVENATWARAPALREVSRHRVFEGRQSTIVRPSGEADDTLFREFSTESEISSDTILYSSLDKIFECLTCHGIFPPFGIRVRPKEGTDNEANEIHGRTDHQHSDRA
ncbi:hypothetical protein [Roseinatronobacter sp.]